MRNTNRVRPICTLKQLRQASPVQDRNSPALMPFKRSAERQPNYPWAQTLDELTAASGPHADAVRANVCWIAIITWLEIAWDQATLTNGCDLSYQVATIMRDDDRVRLALPNRRRKPWSSLLPRLPEKTQAEIRQVAAELIADWQRAGQPFITPDLLKMQHRYMLRFIKSQRNRH